MGNITCQIIIDGKEKQITLQEDIATILRIFNKDSADELTLKKVGDICDDKNNFYIASYQRGYRWGKDEVKALLDDIYEVYKKEVYKKDDSEQKYCLQPLVVKKLEDKVKYTRTLKNLVEGIGKQDNKLEQEVENQQKVYVDDEIYELLDGQQRLTTLWLILSELDRNQETETKKESENKTYQIYYELLRRVDKDFIEQARGIIKNWIEIGNPESKNLNKIKYRDVILRKLTFLWYEVTNGISIVDESTDQNVGNNDSEKLFRKINKGKIELTNAELFKAMLLNEENARTEEDRRELEQISFEWDRVEQSLRNDEFWFFISNDTSEERTRIDYILEVYARGLKVEDEEMKKIEDETKKKEFKNIMRNYKADLEKLDVNKDRYSFLAVNKYLEYCQKTSNGMTLKDIWKDIVSVHDKLYSWYQDNELYHNIGFLVSCEGKRRATATDVVVKLYQNGKDKGIHEVKEIVCGEIFDRLIVKKWKKRKAKNVKRDIEEEFELENLTFDGDKNYLANVLLLYSNIFPLLEQGRGKFPFKAYYSDSWDIEHINPQTKESEIKKMITWGKSENNGKADRGEDEIYSNLNWVRNVELILEYLKKKNNKLLPELKEEDRNKDFCEFSSSESGKDFLEDMEKAWDECQVESDVDAVNNFVLLNSKINRGYHNALFNQKRAKIIEYDKNGFFIPMATKNVFLKYYNENPTEFIEWGKEDREGYLNYLKELFNKVKSWEKYSQKGGKSINE